MSQLLPAASLKLSKYAFVPRAVNGADYVHGKIKPEDVFPFLFFSFERSTEKNRAEVLSKDDTPYILFAPGLVNQSGDSMFCIFKENENFNKEPWFLMKLAPARDIWRIIGYECEMPEPIGFEVINEFSQSLSSFAFVPEERLKFMLEVGLQGDVNDAKRWLSETFALANKYGYLHHDRNSDKMIFSTGLVSQQGNRFFAVLVRNQGNRGTEAWFCPGIFSEDNVTDISWFPRSVREYSCQESFQAVKAPQQTMLIKKPEKKTLLVTAIADEYQMLQRVLEKEKIDYHSASSTCFGKTVSGIEVETLNLFAIQAGSSFKCIIPIYEAIAALSPDQAILSGIAFTLNPNKAPINSVVGSTRVWDYDTSKINSENTLQRGERLDASADILKVFQNTLMDVK